MYTETAVGGPEQVPTLPTPTPILSLRLSPRLSLRLSLSLRLGLTLSLSLNPSLSLSLSPSLSLSCHPTFNVTLTLTLTLPLPLIRRVPICPRSAAARSRRSERSCWRCTPRRFRCGGRSL